MKGKTAIVIGASVGGLVASKVLSKYFESVKIIEKDTLDGSGARKGTPQANHVHVLLVKGKQILSKIFPNFEYDLTKSGGIKYDFIKHARYLVPTGWTPRFDSGLISYSCSRSLLESVIRSQVEKTTNIEFLLGNTVTGFELQDDKVTRITFNELKTSQKKSIECDFVVDCTGRNSQLPSWLKQLHYETPEETRVDSDIGYSTRYYEIPESFEDDWKITVVMNRPPSQPKMGGIFQVEKNQWFVTMYSIGKDHPPTDEAGFLDFAKTLPDKIIFETISDAKPISQIYGYRVEGSRLRHYEKLSSIPKNLIAFGDSVCTFNPFYGQGMTVIALSANVLDDSLKKSLNLKNFSKKFHHQLHKTIQYPWLLATGEDFRWPTTKGKKPNSLTRMMQNYVDKVLLTTPKSDRATKAFQEMMQMVKSPTVMFHPLIFFSSIFQKSRRH